jgi:hypothetical protein
VIDRRAQAGELTGSVSVKVTQRRCAPGAREGVRLASILVAATGEGSLT